MTESFTEIAKPTAGREWWWPRCGGCCRWIKVDLIPEWFADHRWRCPSCRKDEA